VPKPYVRLYPIDVERLPWLRPADAPAGVWEKVLARDPETGSATRLLRVEPGIDTGVFRHDHWEEVLILEGAYKMGDEFHPAGTYTCKGPGIDHGPFATVEGYTCLEFRDFHGAGMDKPAVRLYPIDIERMAWERPEGSPEGVREKLLTIGPSGSATRLLEVDPGVDTGVFRHDHAEEVLLLSGSYKMGEEFHPAGTYTCKGPGVDHGPFWTTEGYTCLEVRNYR
jgi:anti-sigma factor ChrR (cupin superfamily)